MDYADCTVSLVFTQFSSYVLHQHQPCLGLLVTLGFLYQTPPCLLVLFSSIHRMILFRAYSCWLFIFICLVLGLIGVFVCLLWGSGETQRLCHHHCHLPRISLIQVSLVGSLMYGLKRYLRRNKSIGSNHHTRKLRKMMSKETVIWTGTHRCYSLGRDVWILDHYFFPLWSPKVKREGNSVLSGKWACQTPKHQPASPGSDKPFPSLHIS